MNEHLPYSRLRFEPAAAPSASVTYGQARFTLLTSRLIRLEYDPACRFEDRPSQVIWYRRQPVPEFQVRQSDAKLEIVTDHLHLTYEPRDVGFMTSTLSIALTGGVTWRPGASTDGNLLGTARTLDEVSGSTRLDPGLLSLDGWSVVDDTPSLVFDKEGWLRPREADPAARDLYFFGYGRAYRDCLRDFRRIAGGVPLLPRWALGNWWSRYWAYTDVELKRLMEDFRAHAVPLAVCVVDMDWHLVDVGDGVNGWTGYTWNDALFPQPPTFISWLHDQGLKTSLNLHPALGVRPHEAMYAAMARSLGIDPERGEPIPFDIANRLFAESYFKILHHPQEDIGVDFWWMDWQQGTDSTTTGLDPLWWLNHLHFYDLGRNGKRPFIFSRWGGLGNHRYPIGFSGDTVVSWASLAFQPYFTATAANVGYDWWSHDIGGHMHGTEEPELFARWMQFGVFSPILRLHSTKMAFHERRPWAYDAETFRVTRDAMQMRHAFLPYLYTMSRLDEVDGMALVRPMYHDYPDHDEAYACPQQYMFGTELLVAPYTSPADLATRLARQVVWLPPGDWYHFFSGAYYRGDAWYALYGTLDDIPVFARAGGIIPLGPQVGWGGIDNPATVHVHLFAGADGRFVLYEDDGESLAYQQGVFAATPLVQRWQEGVKPALRVAVGPVSGQGGVVPGKRTFCLHIHGVAEPEQVSVFIDGRSRQYAYTWDRERELLLIPDIELERTAALQLTIIAARGGQLLSRRNRTVELAQKLLGAFRMPTLAKLWLAERLPNLPGDPRLLAEFGIELTTSQARALLETTQGVGAHHIAGAKDPHLVVMWNNQAAEDFHFHFTELRSDRRPIAERYRSAGGTVPRFWAGRPRAADWRLRADYFRLVTYTVSGQESESD